MFLFFFFVFFIILLLLLLWIYQTSGYRLFLIPSPYKMRSTESKMDLNESYVDDRRERGNEPIYIPPAAGEPTTSLNLAQTLFQPSEVDESLEDQLAQSISSGDNRRHPCVSTEIPNTFPHEYEKNFLILTSAGKPIYAMNDGDGTIAYMGVIHTIMNYFKLNENQDLRCIENDHIRFAFLDRDPIVLVAYSARGETSNELFNQLDFLHSYLLSSLSERQLSRIFSKRQNFDLRNFLESTDFENLDEICSLLCQRFYPDALLGALRSLSMRKSHRAQLHEAMSQQLIRETDLPRGTLLYGLIVAPDNKLCSVLRPKGHTLHTTDLHLLFSLIFHRFQNLDDSQELWVPICFPKFNANGFLYSYIKFLSRSNSVLVLISAQKDAFFNLKSFADSLMKEISANGLLDQIHKAKGFKINDIPAPLVHHFIYKSRKHVQYVMPELDFHSDAEPEEVIKLEQKFMTYYQQIHNSVVRDDGLAYNKSCLSFIRWDTDAVEQSEEPIGMLGLGWITPRFELYLICNNGVEDKQVVFESARKIISWCRKHESRLFVDEGAIF